MGLVLTCPGRIDLLRRMNQEAALVALVTAVDKTDIVIHVCVSLDDCDQRAA
jgi:hypothetical protein